MKKVRTKPVEFRLEAPPGLGVFVAGTFNDWDPTRNQLVELQEGGGYALTLKLSLGTHQYRFIVGGDWQSDPRNPATVPDGYCGVNSVLTVE